MLAAIRFSFEGWFAGIGSELVEVMLFCSEFKIFQQTRNNLKIHAQINTGIERGRHMQQGQINLHLNSKIGAIDKFTEFIPLYWSSFRFYTKKIFQFQTFGVFR
jgi:hypothetical protein